MCILNKGSVNSIPEVKNMDKISVVVPCYNEEEALPVYYKEMCRVMDEMKDVVFELIFVDDGSSDATLGIMKDMKRIAGADIFHFPETLERKLRFMQD